jgi:hypothetical protein
MVITRSSIEVFAIRESSSTILPDLVLLHCISTGLTSLFTSRPFVGSHGIHLLGIRDNVFKRVNLSCDLVTPPTVEELGPLEFTERWTTSHARFGPLASVFFQGRDCIDVVSYALSSQLSPNFQRRRYKLDRETLQHGIRTVAGLDDNVGRIVLKSDFKSCFQVLDLI